MHKLTPRQGARLRDLIEAYGGLHEFANAVNQEETGATGVLKDTKGLQSELTHICAGRRSFTTRKRSAFARVLGFHYSDGLTAALDAPADAVVLPRALVPWIIDTAIIAKYRTVFHHYHQARYNDNDYFWLYTKIDFSQHPQPTFLYAPIRYGMGRGGRFTVFGYLSGDMLVLRFRNEESPDKAESVQVFPFFREPESGHLGHFGVLWNQNRDGTQGLGGSLLFAEPFPGAESPGELAGDINEDLNNFWRIMKAPQCNRLLTLCNCDKLIQSKTAASELEAILVVARQRSLK